MANTSKKQLAREITEWINDMLKNNEDPDVQALYHSMPRVVETYFYSNGSLRLRSEGNRWMSIHFHHEKFPLERPLNTGEILLLSENLNAPFMLNSRELTLYSGEHCALLKMSGDVMSWLDNFR